MNKVYKLVWSKVRNSYVVASELAKSHTKSPKSGVMNQAVVSGVLVCVLACGAVLPVYAAGQEVTYDDNTDATITLQGPTGTGTKITNLADGTISAGSSDAVTGKQLYSLTQTVNGFQSSLSTLNTTLASTQATLNTTKASVLGMQDTLNSTATAVENGFNVNINGAKLKTVNPDSAYLNFKAGDGISLTNDNGSLQVAVNGDGVVASGNTGAITGGIAYTELRPTNGNYILQANTTAANLTALDTQLKTTTDNLATEVTNRTNADTALSDRIGTLASNGNYITTTNNAVQNISALDTQLKTTADNLDTEITNRTSADTALGARIDALSGDTVHYDDNTKVKVTLEGTNGTTIDNVKAGTLSATSMEAVNGSQLYTTNQNLATEISNRQTAITNEATTRSDADTALSDRIGTVASDRNYIKASTSKNVAENLGLLDTQVKANANAITQEITDRGIAITNEASARSTEDTNLSNRIGAVAADGNYIKASSIKNVAENLGLLDTQVKSNADEIAQEITDRGIAVTNEATARQNADTALSDRIDALDGNTVKYDDSTKAKITFEGTNGTTLDKVAAGTLSATSMEAVNGSQLYTTNQNLATEISDRQTAITNEATARSDADTILGNRIGSVSADGNYIKASTSKNVAENLGLLDTQVKANTDAITQEIADRGTAVANEATARSTEDTNLSNRIGVVASDGNYIKASSTKNVAENLGLLDTQLKTTADGLASEITRASNAETALGNRIGTLTTNGNYIVTTNDVYQNLTALDTQVKANADTIVANKTHFYGVNSTDSTNSNYDGAGATGSNSVAIGVDSSASSGSSIALGYQATASGTGFANVAVGYHSSVLGSSSLSMGDNTSASGQNAVALGAYSTAGDYSVAIGSHNSAPGSQNISIGSNVTISSTPSTYTQNVAIGHQLGLNGSDSVVIGHDSYVNGNLAVAIGNYSRALQNESTAVGMSTLANCTHSSAFGVLSKAEAEDSLAIGTCAYAKGNASIAINTLGGDNSTQYGAYSQGSIAIGGHASSRAQYASALGYGAEVTGTNGLSLGYNSRTLTNSSLAIGDTAYSSGGASIAIGKCSYSNGGQTIALGVDANAGGGGTIAVGYGANAASGYNVAIGQNANATIGTNSVALGSNSVAQEQNVLSLGKDAVGNVGDTDYVAEVTRKIQHVTAGVNDTDAVNVKQLNDQKVEYVGVNAVWKDWSDLTNDEKIALGVTTEAEYNALVVGSNRNGEQAIGRNAIAVGKNAIAGVTSHSSALDMVAIGTDSQALDSRTVAIGQKATAGLGNDNGTSSIAIGSRSLASGHMALAIGGSDYTTESTQATGEHAIALGVNAHSTARNSTAIGRYSEASDYSSIAIGHQAKSTAQAAIVIGDLAKSDSFDSIVIGTSAVSQNAGSRNIILGNGSTIKGDGDSIAIGQTAKVNYGWLNLAIGDSAVVGDESVNITTNEAIAIGNGAKATGDYATSLGMQAVTQNKGATAVGAIAKATELNSSAYGTKAEAKGQSAVAIGYCSIADASYSVAIGDEAFAGNSADGYTSSTAIGYKANASGFSGVAIGRESNAFHRGIAIGSKADAQYSNSMAIGDEADTNAVNSTAIGYHSQANAMQSLAIGELTRANSASTVALGNGANASGLASAAIGSSSKTLEGESVALGYNAKANSTGTSALGASATASGCYAFAAGYAAAACDTKAIAIGFASNVSGSSGLALGDTAKTASYGVSLGANADSLYNSIAIGHSAQSKGGSTIAVGANSSSMGGFTVAIGESAYAGGGSTIAIGHAASTGSSGYNIAIGENAKATSSSNSIALGNESDTNNNENVLSIGHDAYTKVVHNNVTGEDEEVEVSALTRKITHVTAGTNATDAVNVSQLTNAITAARTRYFGVNANPEEYNSNENGEGATGTNAVAIGTSPMAMGNESIALGSVASTMDEKGVAMGYLATSLGKNAVAIGSCTQAVMDNTIAIGNNAAAPYEGSIAIGYNSEADEANVVSFGKKAVMDGDTIVTPELTRKLTHVRGGSITETSTEAINGSQLYSVKQDISGFATDINKNSDNIRALNTSVTSALASVAASGLLVDTMDANKADASLNNLTASGKRVLKTYAENAVQEYMAAQGLSSPMAPVAPMAVGNTNSNTLSITDAGNGSLHVGEGSYVNGTSSIAIGVGNQVNANNSGAFGDPSIINADESYVLGNDDTINTGATGSFIVGNDSVSDAKGALILGSNTKANVGAENGIALGNNAEVSAKNAIALGAGSVAGEENTLSIGNTELQRKIVNMADGSIAEGSHEAVTGGQLFVTNENVQKNADAIEANRQAIEKKAEVDASNINTADWAAKLGVGKVEDGNRDLVTGGAVYNAMQDVKAVADFVKESDGVISIAPNSAATKINIGGASGEGRVLTGIVTDANDASSAANVGYVNDVTTNIANQMNRGLNKVNDRLDKVGAGAAAMAGLVPGPMDGDEKWSVSAAVGNYRSATAGAVGAFYKPTDNVMIAVKGSFGSDENMVSGGVGISLNKGNVPGVSKAQMVRTINAQANEIQGLKASNEAQTAMIQNQAHEIAELKAMMTELASKIK